MADITPVTRKEKILSGDLSIEPVTREEQLLYALIAGGGGGGGGTTNYNVLSNKPKINGVELKGDKSSADLNIDTTLSDDLDVTVAVGGIKSGRKYNKGDSMETVLRELLNPVANPTLTPPSARLTSNAARTIFGIDEPIGALKFDLTFDQGKISPAYGTNGKRAGTASSYSIDGQSGASVNIDMDARMPNGIRQITITGNVAYGKGPQPKNSIGEDYSTPLQAGTVSDTLVFERKAYIYANKNGTFEKLPITEYNASPTEIELKNEDPPNQATIAFPARATKIETWDTLEREWEDVSWEWLEEQVTIDGMTYWKYTDNRGYRAGERQLRFTW